MKKTMFVLVMIVVFGSVLVSCSKEEHAGNEQTVMHEEKDMESAGKEISQMICPIMGKPVSKEFFGEHEGEKVYLCCKKCVKAFKENPEEYMKKLK